MKILLNTVVAPKTEKAFTRVLKGLMKQRADSGVITLREFRKAAGGMSVDPIEASAYLKQRGGNTDFIVGRRGHPSRFVFNEAFDKWVHQEAIRAEWRKANGRDPMTGRLLQSNESPRRRGRPPGSRNIVTNGNDRRRIPEHVEVTVGNKTLRLPMKEIMLKA